MYKISTLGGSLGIGAVGARYVTIEAVAKANGPQAPYCLPNELICAEIAGYLRLPIPPCAVVTSSTGPPQFASLDFNLTGKSLPPATAQDCCSMAPYHSAGLLLFDILVANSDRYGMNLSLDKLAKPPRLMIFDHSHALFGNSASQGTRRLQAMSDRLAITGGPFTGGNRHLFLDILDSDRHFAHWVARIKNIPDFFIEEICRDVQPYGITKTEREAAETFLKQRRDKYATLLSANQHEFSAVKIWTLV